MGGCHGSSNVGGGDDLAACCPDLGSADPDLATGRDLAPGPEPDGGICIVPTSPSGYACDPWSTHLYVLELIQRDATKLRLRVLHDPDYEGPVGDYTVPPEHDYSQHLTVDIDLTDAVRRFLCVVFTPGATPASFDAASPSFLTTVDHSTYTLLRDDATGVAHVANLTDICGGSTVPGMQWSSIAGNARGRSYLVMQDHADGAVVAEVDRGDRARRVDVRAGRYFVRGRGGNHLIEGTVALAAGERHLVRDDELQRIEYARLVRKGGTPLTLVHGPEAGYRLRTGVTSGSSLCQGLFAGWNVTLKHLSITPRVAYCGSSLTNAMLTAATDAFEVELALAHAFDFPYVTFELGLLVGGALLHQTFVTAGSAPPRTSGAFALGPTGAVSVDLPRGFYAFGLVAGETYFLNRVARDETSTFGPAFTVSSSLGVGRRF